MSFPELTRLSPNRDPVPPHECAGVLFHHSVMPFAETLTRLLDPASKVSYHALIDLDGTRCTLVPDEQIAWHAGASSFLGRTRCNDFLLGLAFAGDTNAAHLVAIMRKKSLIYQGIAVASRRAVSHLTGVQARSALCASTLGARA